MGCIIYFLSAHGSWCEPVIQLEVLTEWAGPVLCGSATAGGRSTANSVCTKVTEKKQLTCPERGF